MSEAETRSQRKENKINNVFPKVSDVWTISHFLRHDIGWPAAKVVPNGADHVNVGHVGRERKTEIVRVGFLSRLGQLEAEYKGNDLFVGLAERFTDDERVEFLVMGRGNREDIAMFKQAGISVRLNATDDERAAFFRDVDVFFSPSRWEGFNLPLAEAQYAGCAAFAFDVGAHPETTPFIVGSLSDAEILLRHWLDNPASLKAAGERCQRFVKDRFTWEVSARRFADLLNDVSPRPNRWPALMRRVRLVIRRDGIRGLGRKLAGRFLRR